MTDAKIREFTKLGAKTQEVMQHECMTSFFEKKEQLIAISTFKNKHHWL
jgi:hypothetical protein